MYRNNIDAESEILAGNSSEIVQFTVATDDREGVIRFKHYKGEANVKDPLLLIKDTADRYGMYYVIKEDLNSGMILSAGFGGCKGSYEVTIPSDSLISITIKPYSVNEMNMFRSFLDWYITGWKEPAQWEIVEMENVWFAHEETENNDIDEGSYTEEDRYITSPYEYGHYQRQLQYKSNSMMKGDDVRFLQQALNIVVDAGLEVDGIFGPKTKASVRSFQDEYGLEVDGIYGKKSNAKMEEVLSQLGFDR